MDGWLTRVEKPWELWSPFLRSTAPVTTELGICALLTGSPAFGLRAISGHAATKRPVKARAFAS
jgi:hypothetical protein